MDGGKEGILKRRNRSINEKQEKRYMKKKKKLTPHSGIVPNNATTSSNGIS